MAKCRASGFGCLRMLFHAQHTATRVIADVVGHTAEQLAPKLGMLAINHYSLTQPNQNQAGRRRQPHPKCRNKPDVLDHKRRPNSPAPPAWDLRGNQSSAPFPTSPARPLSSRTGRGRSQMSARENTRWSLRGGGSVKGPDPKRSASSGEERMAPTCQDRRPQLSNVRST